MMTMGAGALMGFYIRMQAQKQADFMAVAKLGIEVSKVENKNQNDASKRDGEGWGAITRRAVILMVIGVSFLGLIYSAVTDTPVSFMYETEIKSHLFGLFTTGGKLETIVANGFVIPPYVPHMISAVSGFLFGAGASKVKR